MRGKALLLQVITLAGDDVPHAAARVRHVAVVARDEVDVQVVHGAPRRHAFVYPDVVAVRAELGVDELLDVQQERVEVQELFFLELEEGLHVALRHYLEVAPAHREVVPAGVGKLVLHDDAVLLLISPVTEETRVLWHAASFCS